MKSFGFMVGMSIAGAMVMLSTPARAEMTCSICDANYAACRAAGGNPGHCWTPAECNNPSCPPQTYRSGQKSLAVVNPKYAKKELVAVVTSK
jgi:hypothetical protein